MINGKINNILPELNLDDNRNKQIKMILDLGRKNEYATELYQIYEMTVNGTLTELEAYQRINSVLVRYDFEVIMPLENEEIRKKREQACKDIVSKKCCVPIWNEEDEIEVAVKTKLSVGEVLKNFKAIVERVGMDTNFKGGRQKKETEEKLSQYISIINIIEGKHPKKIQEIYEIPHLIDKEDGRGKKGYYIDRTVPIAFTFLYSNVGENSIYNTNINSFSKELGIVGRDYRSIKNEQLLRENDKYTYFMINQFYSRCAPNQREIVCRTLDRLQNEYSIIHYYNNFCIETEDGKKHTSSKEEDDWIYSMQSKVLDEFQAKGMYTIFARRQQIKYYNRVVERINERMKEVYEKKGLSWVNWKKYCHQIEIHVHDAEKLSEYLPMFMLNNRELKRKKIEVNKKFKERQEEKLCRQIERTNAVAKTTDGERNKWWESIKERIPQDILDLIDIGIYTIEDIQNLFLENTFVYHDNYYDIQKGLMSRLLRIE